MYKRGPHKIATPHKKKKKSQPALIKTASLHRAMAYTNEKEAGMQQQDNLAASLVVGLNCI